MNRFLRLALSFCAALSLVAAGQALARAAPLNPPALALVLCTGGDPAVVYLDADGRPVAPPQHCPECDFAPVHAMLPPAAPGPVPRTARPERTLPLPVGQRAGTSCAGPGARDPPAPA